MTHHRTAFVIAAILACTTAQNACHSAVHKASCHLESDPRACIDCVRRQPDALFTGTNCTAPDLRSACRGEGHPNVFGCSDVTSAGCSSCFDHAVAFVHVCVWCTKDSECHDVGSLLDTCTKDQCISQAVKSTCTLPKTDCPSLL